VMRMAVISIAISKEIIAADPQPGVMADQSLADFPDLHPRIDRPVTFLTSEKLPQAVKDRFAELIKRDGRQGQNDQGEQRKIIEAPQVNKSQEHDQGEGAPA